MLEVAELKDVGERYVFHQLMVSDFRVALAIAARARGVTVAWRRFPKESTIRPDGFFSLQFPELPEGRNRAFFFLEADRSTMACDRFRAKLAAYADWRRGGRHIALLGIKNFRVLTVTRSEARLDNLARVAAEVDAGGPVFWFSAEGRLATADAILASVWTVPRIAVPQSIVPASSQAETVSPRQIT